MTFEAVYAHAPGQSATALSVQHCTLLTTGPDLLMNAFPLSPSVPHLISTTDSPAECRPHPSGCSLCLASNGDMAVSGGSGGDVVVLRLPEMRFERVAMQFGLAVRAVAVSSGGRFIAAGGDECEVKVVDGESRQKTFKGHTSRICAVAISEKAPIVASLAVNGEVKLWNIVDDNLEPIHKNKVVRLTHEWNGQISFNKNGNLLAIPDGHNITVFDDSLDVVTRLESDGAIVIGCCFNGNFLFASKIDGQVDAYRADGDSFEHEQTIRVSDCAILSIAVSDSTIYAVDEQGNARSGKLNLEIASRKVTKNVQNASIVEEVDLSDSNESDTPADDDGDVEMEKEEPIIVRTQYQQFNQYNPFSPNNTPYQENCRYLAWNAVGKVIARRDPLNHSSVSIDVDFADSRHHRPIHFTDDYSLEMASLHDSGCVFANHSTLLYMPTVLSSWTLKVNTVLEFEEGEEERIVSVACNQSHIYCLTNLHFRIMNTSGCQLAIISVPGTPLSVTANDNVGLVIYGESESIKSVLIDNRLAFSQPMVITKHQPIWCGTSLSDDCELFGVLDVKGHFYTYTHDHWTCIHKQALKLWPVFFTTKHLHAVVLHDTIYPDILPVPLVSEIVWSVPLMKNPFESTLSKSTNQLHVDQVLVPFSKETRLKTIADKNTLELIQIAIKMDHHQRALDLYKMLFTAKSRELAVQLAHHARATALAERMTMTSVVQPVESVPEPTIPTLDEIAPKPKRRLYVPDEDTQLPPVYSQESTIVPSQERVNPFSKPQPSSQATSENYVNVLEKLTQKY